MSFSSRSYPPLVLPAALASAFRGALSSIDVRVVMSVKQMIDGYKTVDRVIVATREGFFLCIAATGEFSRYVKWEMVQEVHWYPSLQLAAFVCGDGCDVVLAASSSSSSSSTTTGAGGNNGNGNNPSSSPPTSPRPSTLSFGHAPPLAPQQQQQPNSNSSSSTSSIPSPLRSIVQRVRSSTVNFGRNRPVAGAGNGSTAAASGTPGSATSNNSNVSMFAFGASTPTTGAPPQQQQQSPYPDIVISPFTGGTTASSFVGDVSPPSSTNEDASQFLLASTSGGGPQPTQQLSASYRQTGGIAQWGGRLPLGPTAPSTLVEFIEWASALSHSRAYHAIVPNAFIVIQNTTEHLNAWQAYRVKRPAGLTMDVPIEVIPREHLNATDQDLADAKLRRHEDDTRSAGELRRAALMLGGLHIVNELIQKDWERNNTVEDSPQQRPVMAHHYPIDHQHHIDPMSALHSLSYPQEERLSLEDGPLSSSLMGEVEVTAPFTEASTMAAANNSGPYQVIHHHNGRYLPQSPSTSSLNGRQQSRRDSDYSFDDPNSFGTDGGGGRRRGLTLFCSGADDGNNGSCTTVGGGAYRVTGDLNAVAAIAAQCASGSHPSSSSGQSGSAPTSATRNSRGVRSVANDDADDGFVVIDNPETRIWRSSPPHDLPQDDQCSWWRQHCSALVMENKGLRQEADELRLRLSMLQHEVNVQRGAGGVMQGEGPSSMLSSSQRRHRLPF